MPVRARGLRDVNVSLYYPTDPCMVLLSGPTSSSQKGRVRWHPVLCEEVTRTLSGGPYRSQGSSAVAAPKKGPVCPGNETESQLCQVFNGGEMILLWRPPPVLPEARQVAERGKAVSLMICLGAWPSACLGHAGFPSRRGMVCTPQPQTGAVEPPSNNPPGEGNSSREKKGDRD